MPPLRLQRAAYALWKNKVEFFLVSSVFLLGFAFYLWIFWRNQLLPMIDGPYYLIQVRSILTTGGLVYGDPPLTFYLLSFFSILLGDTLLGVKVAVALFSALSTVPAYFLMKKVGKNVLAGLTAMLLVVFSGTYIRMLTDFMKNAIGVCWLFAFIYYLHDLAINGIRKSSLALAAFFLVLTGLTHILDFAVALLFLLLFTMATLAFNVNRRSFLKSAGVLAFVVSVFVFIASAFFSFFFSDFNKIFVFVQELTAPKVSGVADAPTLPNQESAFGPQQPYGIKAEILSTALGFGMIVLVLSVGAVLSLYAWRSRKEKEALVLLSVVTVVGSLLCFPLIPSDWLMRTELMIVIPTAIILSYGISRIWRFNIVHSKPLATVLLAICLLLFVVQSVGVASIIHPTISEAGYSDLVSIQNQIPSNSVVAVSDYGIRYWVEYVDKVDTTHGIIRINQIPSDLWQSYSHVLGLFFKNQIPQIPFKTIYVGKVYVLAEL